MGRERQQNDSRVRGYQVLLMPLLLLFCSLLSFPPRSTPPPHPPTLLCSSLPPRLYCAVLLPCLFLPPAASARSRNFYR